MIKAIKRILYKLYIALVRQTLYRLYITLGRWYLYPLLRLEWEMSKHKELTDRTINERPIEFGFALKWISKICPVEVLDVGSGTTAWPHIMANCGIAVTAIDKIQGYWENSFFNRHYYVINDDITKPNITKQFDLITCISVLEHIPDHKKAISEMIKLLKPGGHLVLTFPYNEKQYIDNVYKLPDAGYGQKFLFICHVFSRRELDQWIEGNGARIVEQEYYEIFTRDLWTFGERIYPPRKVEKGEKCHLTCVLLQKT
jgi:SAM-dependent methyltransferase